MYKCDLFLQTKQMVKNKLSATFVVEINGVLNFKKKKVSCWRVLFLQERI